MKWELEFGQILGHLDLESQTKKMELGLEFQKIWENNRLGNKSWAKLDLENWLYYPPLTPSEEPSNSYVESAFTNHLSSIAKCYRKYASSTKPIEDAKNKKNKKQRQVRKKKNNTAVIARAAVVLCEVRASTSPIFYLLPSLE